MKKLALSFVLVVCVLTQAIGASGKKTIPLVTDFRTAKVTNTYAANQVDTVIYNCPAGLSGLAFGIHAKDSMKVTTIVIRRVVDGALMAAIATDTLDRAAFLFTTDGSSGSTTFSDGASATAAVTLAPLCDQFLFIVTYSATGNGVTSPTAVYEGIQQLSKKP